jgi:hypothetical protein
MRFWWCPVEIGERLFGSKWFKAQVEREAAKDKVSPSESVGQIVGVAATIIVIVFVAIHQTRPTGFFTDEFGTAAATLLYAMLVFGMVPQLVRFLFGRKNTARPFDAASLALFFVGGLYFLVVFPFDFTHFAEPLPRALEPLLEWISATLAKWVLGIGVVASPFFSIYTFFLHIAVKKRLLGAHMTTTKTES